MDTYPRLRLVNPYVLPVLYVRKPGDDNETTIRFHDDDPFFSEISNLIDIIEDIEEEPEAAQILSSYDGKSNPFFSPSSALSISFQTRYVRTNSRGPFVRRANDLGMQAQKEQRRTIN